MFGTKFFSRHRALSCLLIMISLCSLIHLSPATPAAENQAILLDIKSAIGPGLQDFIHRSMKTAEKQQAKLIILRMDTPGGLSKSMREIIKDILASPIPVVTYVAPSGARAASAGTYILYASHIAAMSPGTNLGAATPVTIGVTGKNEKEKKQITAREQKVINDARAYIRGLAQLRGRNVQWAEEAVSKASSLSAEEALKKNVIDVIAADIPDLLNKINGKVVSVKGQSFTLKTTNLSIKTIEPDWRSRFLSIITDPSVAYILLMIGVYGLFFEFANPGLVVPGVVGAICLLIALYALQLLPINYAGLGLILLGIAFIVAEAFIPSFGALGIGGIVAFAVGSIMLLKTGVVGFAIPMGLIIATTITTALFFLLVIQMAWRSRKRPVVSGQEALVGKQGVVIKEGDQTWVMILGERWRCNSDSPLQEGESVTVIKMEGLTLKVKPKEKE